MQPKRLNTAIATLFIIGSMCFALGTVPWYVTAVGAPVTAMTYFVGSLFFTSASLMQLLQVQTPEAWADADRSGESVRLKLWGPRRDDKNWLAAATQFPGTLAFNVSTAFAINTSLTLAQSNRLIWAPDFVGSVLFLVSSAFAVLAVSTPFLSWSPHDIGWRIAWINMLGSVFFMLSALGSVLLPATGAMFDSRWAALGTLLGALCFLWGAALMFPLWRATPEGCDSG